MLKWLTFSPAMKANLINEDPCVPPVLVMDTPIPRQHTNCQTNDGSNAKSPKKRGGARKKSTKKDPNEPEDESPLSSSVSSSDSDDPEEEFDPFSGSTYFRLSDFSFQCQTQLVRCGVATS